MNEYTVETPLRANVLAGVDTSSGDGLPDDYDFGVCYAHVWEEEHQR